MGLEIVEDLKRKPIEWNLLAAKKLLSPYTGFVHFCYESKEHCRDAIPLLENFCFSLALLRSRTAENVLKAKNLLERLLAFEIDGNFPIYIHDFPQCKKRSLGVDLMPIFYWIFKDFEAVIGDELSLRLQQLMGRLVSWGLKTDAQRPLHPISLMKLNAYFSPHLQPVYTPVTAEEWGDALIAYQMAKAQGVEWNALWQQALAVWNPSLCTATLSQQQDQYQPKATLFDLWMGYYHSRYSERVLSLKDLAPHLRASLIQPLPAAPIAVGQRDSLMSTSSPYTLFWGSPEMLHTLFLDIKKGALAGEFGEWTLTLPPHVPPEGEESLECAFFLNLHPAHQIYVGACENKLQKASAWQLTDPIEIHSEGQVLFIRFSLVEGEGTFYGHLQRGNRPVQKSGSIFDAYDWQIALRTIRRSEHCVLRISCGAVR